MQINIKKLDGQKEEFSLEPSDSVMKVKEMLAEKTGVHKDQIRLIFKGKPMLDDKVHAAHHSTTAAQTISLCCPTWLYTGQVADCIAPHSPLLIVVFRVWTSRM